MLEPIFHNPFLRGYGIVLIAELIVFVLMCRHRKPGVSLMAVIYDDDSLTPRGLRVRKWWDAISAVTLVWFVGGMVAWGVKMWMA